LATALVTTVVFKLSKQYGNNDIQLQTAVAYKQVYSNRTSKIDWHDWKFINMEKQRIGKNIILLLVIYFTTLY